MVLAASILSYTLPALLVATGGNAFTFIIGHRSLLRTRLDAVISPGKIAGHVHLFSGASSISESMTFEGNQAAKCTTSTVTVDKSGYWAPQLYYKWRNGTFTAIDGHGTQVYWNYRGFKVGDVPPVLPDDFRMIAGNLSRDHTDLTKAEHMALTFPCFGTGANGEEVEGEFHNIPNHDCPTIRPQIVFPRCWNGVDSFKADNSHVAYALGNPDHGPCPEGFIRIPGLFVENYYSPRFTIGPEYEWYPGCLVFSNGDNFGLSFHVDWLNGFPRGLWSDVFVQCEGKSTGLNHCEELSQYRNPETDCLAQNDPNARLVNEPIGLSSPIDKLPGNNPVFNSSREGNQPRMVDPNYVDVAQIVPATEEGGGTCRGNSCEDYRGPTGGGVGNDNEPVAGVGGTGTTTNGAGSNLGSTSALVVPTQSLGTSGYDNGSDTPSSETTTDTVLTTKTPAGPGTAEASNTHDTGIRTSGIGGNLGAQPPTSTAVNDPADDNVPPMCSRNARRSRVFRS